MPQERRIEKLLRAFAKKRKADAGAPLEMHPATRRLLQGEVARRAKGRPTTEQAWWRFWFGTPRRAFAVCAMLSLLISGTVFLTTMKPTKPGMNLAKNETATIAGEPKAQPVEKRMLQPAPAAPAATTPEPEMPVLAGSASSATTEADRKNTDTGLMSYGGGGGASGSGGTAPAAASAPMVAYDDASVNGTTSTFVLNGPAGANADAAKADSSIALQKDVVDKVSVSGAMRELAATSAVAPALDTEKQLYAESKAPASTTSTLNFASGYRFKNKGALAMNDGVVTQFYRIPATTDQTDARRDRSHAVGVVKKQRAGDVLDSFTVTQDGNSITVVDSDGSQYSGSILPAALKAELADVPATVTTPGQTAPTRRAVGTLTGKATYNLVTTNSFAAPDFTFNVTGTNLSLHQLVVFSGNIVALTNGVATRGLMTNALKTDTFGPQSLLQNSQIEGRATVGPKKTPVEINAAPTGQ